MDTGESSGTASVITTIIKEDGKIKPPRREAPMGRKGERNSERYIPENNVSRIPITSVGIWLELEKALDKRKILDQWVESLVLAGAITWGKLEPQDMQVFFESTLTEGHYANECPQKNKRTTKALLFEEYEDIVEEANLKGYEVAYSDEEDNRSVYSAYITEEGDSFLESDTESEEVYQERSKSSKLKIGKKALQKK
ncbi:hypothetical protein M0R45_004555 [Rubus argutus]|uniref:Uncharacterized protein n=1 Tax=Rubus argutus TaxID=59490 RepID=A0AAW1YK49_RUBAR